MANLTNAIMSNYLHQHEHDEEDSDDDVDDDEYFDDGEDDHEGTSDLIRSTDQQLMLCCIVHSSPPFSFAPNPQLVQQAQGPRTNDQGGFQFNFDQPFNPNMTRYQFETLLPGTSYHFGPTRSEVSGPMFNFNSGQQQPGPYSINITMNVNDNNGNNAQNNSQHDNSDFDPNSLHDVD